MDVHGPAGLRQRLEEALGGAYVLERELGGGGMSRVFLARDARLGRQVVVKVLAPDLGAGISAARFEREVQLAARLQHPHVIPLLSAGDVGGLPYYMMPYVEGQTLRARLTAIGALPVAEAVGLLRELADALAYAHGAGVVHRDLKPENVLLSAGHAVVADFGVAKALAAATQGGAEGAAAGADATGTALGVAVGTPAYMAPEQLAADPAVDARADLYALGCVAYELLTGAPPFVGRTPHGLMAAHLTETPVPLTERRVDVPPALASLVARLLAKAPEDRPQSANEVRRALDAVHTTGDTTAADASASRSGSDRRRVGARGVWLGAGAAVAVALALAAWSRGTRGAEKMGAGAADGAAPVADSVADAAIARRVLVVPFENATGDPTLAPLGRMAAEWLAQGLAESGDVDVAAASGRAVSAGEAGLRAAASEAGAGTIVSGAYFLEGDSVRLQARVTDVRAWRLLAPLAPVHAPRSAPQRLLAPLRARVAATLAVAHDATFPRLDEGGVRVPDYDAYREFATGFDLFDRGDFAGALPHWRRAAALDTAFASPSLIAAQAEILLGNPAGAETHVRRLEGRREALSPFERGILDRLRAVLAGDRSAALAGARSVRRAAPGWSLGYTLVTFEALWANRPREALEAAAHLEAAGMFARANANGTGDVPPAAVDARHLLGDYAGELTAARAERAGKPDLPDGLAQELRALAALGRVAELGSGLDALDGLPAAVGRVPSILSALADELDAHSQGAAATRVRERVISAQLADGYPPAQTRGARAARGHALALLGRDAAADTLFAHLVSEVPTEPAYLAERGMIAVRQGRRAEAERVEAQLRALRRPYDWGQTAYARAQLAAARGDVDGALTLLKTALAAGVSYGPLLHADPAFAPLRADPSFRELLRPKG